MSLDVAGPFHKGNDVDGQAKFMLVGTYTWIKPQQEAGEEAPPPEAEEADQVEDQGREDGRPEGQPEDEEEGPQLKIQMRSSKKMKKRQICQMKKKKTAGQRANQKKQ